jgi:hypothetical protein
LEGTSFVWSERAFDAARRAINRVHNKALGIASYEKSALAHNALLAALDPVRFPPQHRGYRKDAIADAIGAAVARTTVLSPRDQSAALAATMSAVRSVERTRPEALLELSREIEVVSLEGLLGRLRAMLERRLKEDVWHTFFKENSFVLRLAFGLPII